MAYDASIPIDGGRIGRAELVDVDLELVSAVPAGDNPDARIVLLKGSPSVVEPPDAWDALNDAGMARTTAPQPVDNAAEDTVTLSKADWDAVQAYVETLEKHAGHDDDDWDGDDDDEYVTKGAPRVKHDDDDEDFIAYDEDDDDEKTDLADEPKVHAKGAAKGKVVEKSADLETLLKANPALAGAFYELESRATAAEKVAKRALSAALAERDRANEVELRKHAASLPNIGTEAEMTDLLKSLHGQLDADTFRRVERKFVELNGAIEESGLTKSVGFSGAGWDGSDPNDPLGSVMALAKAQFGGDIAKSSADEAAALLSYLETNPDAYASTLAQIRGAR